MTWAKRLKRVFDIDIETCSECGGDVRVIASIEDPSGTVMGPDTFLVNVPGPVFRTTIVNRYPAHPVSMNSHLAGRI